MEYTTPSARRPTTKRAATGWPLAVGDRVEETPAPTETELDAFRDLQGVR